MIGKCYILNSVYTFFPISKVASLRKEVLTFRQLEPPDVGELGALLGESPDEVSEGLIGLLPASPEVPGVPRAHVSALEVPDEDLDEVGPVVDHAVRKVLEPCSSCIGQMQWEVADDE